MAPRGRKAEVAKEKKKTRLMKKRLGAVRAAVRAKKRELSIITTEARADRTALRAKNRERSMRKREHDQWLGIFLTGESLAAAFLELEEDGEMNLGDQNAMKEAIAACMNNFGAGHGNNGAGFAAGI